MFIHAMNLKRMSFSRLVVLLISMSLILYLFYDFMAFKSKPIRGTNLLTKMQALRDSVHFSKGRQELKKEFDEQKDENTGRNRPINVDGNVKLESSEKKADDGDTKNSDKLIKHEVSEKVSEEKNNNHSNNEDHKEVRNNDVERKSIEEKADDNGVKTVSNYRTNWSVIEKSMKKKINAYRKAIEYEEHLKDTNATFTRVINRARYMSGSAQNSKIVLLSFVCKSCLPFVNSWLCNTRELGIHRSVLLLVRGLKLRRTLLTAWPDINVVAMQPNLSNADPRMNKIALSLGRVQLINALLHANVNLLLFDLKSVWFENPVPNLQQSLDADIDILINSVPKSHLNTGFLALFATEKTQLFWKDLYGKLRNVVSKWKESDKRMPMDLDEYYEDYLEKMIESRYEAVTVRMLPIHAFTDGVWYLLSEEERAKTRPVVIRNNYIEGNEQKIQRAKQWTHWFLQDDGTCNVDLVMKTVRL